MVLFIPISETALSFQFYSSQTHKSSGSVLILTQIKGKFLFFNEAINPPKFATPQITWAWILQNAVQNPYVYTDELNTPPVGLFSESTVQKTLSPPLHDF